MSPGPGLLGAWLLTRAISPRERVRVAAVDATGEVLNQYSRTWPVINPEQPKEPWAVALASPEGFCLLAFDFDAKVDEVAAAEDAARLSQLLTDVGIAHLVCRSGPSGGRHIWAATSEAIDPGLIGTMARLAAAMLPSLDISPLRNSATGCVRPPGAPHRDGGHSEVLAGDIDCLLHGSSDRAAIERLVRALAARVNTDAPSPCPSADSSTRIDEHGHPYLPGTRRPLPRASSAALEAAAVDLDASTVLNTVLLGAAASHWRLHDVAELVATAPGLEHVRTRRGTRGRTPRRRQEQIETLARQWRYAVRFVAESPRHTGIDSTFDQRAGEVVDTVHALQERADASPGRWTQGGGPSDRRVLDTLHLWALTAVVTTIEADVRRIALTSGIGRETARIALHRLAADGWIRLGEAASGVHGATWQIDPQSVIPIGTDTTRSQAATRPEGAGAAERTALLSQLTRRMNLATHDVFSGSYALPPAAGNLYARLADPASPSSAATDEALLHRLATFNLIVATGSGWALTDPNRRDSAATQLAVDGRLARRRERYRAERAAWSWWQAEHEWMCGPRKRRDARGPVDQVPLWEAAGAPTYPKHPRRSDGRADFQAARTALRSGVLASSPVFAAA